MNKEPQEVDWSKQKPGTIGVTRDGWKKFEFIASRNDKSTFYQEVAGFIVRGLNGRLIESRFNQPLDILLPWESCLAEGHNPNGLTNGQVGDGWRLIGNYTDDLDSRVQYYSHLNKTWFNRDHESGPYISGGTYRVPITPPVAKVPVAKATKRVPCGPEHFPPGTVVRTAGCTHWQAILWARPSGLGAIGPSLIPGEEKYERLMNDGIERSIDGGKTWLPCYVEVEE
jgi:hypothetical protein